MHKILSNHLSFHQHNPQAIAIDNELLIVPT